MITLNATLKLFRWARTVEPDVQYEMATELEKMQEDGIDITLDAVNLLISKHTDGNTNTTT